MKKIVYTALALTLLVSCTSKNSEIAIDNVGAITRTTTVSELTSLFSEDSIVDDNPAKIVIFENGGDKILELEPAENGTQSTIKYIRVFSPEYKTTGGVGINSTFKDIQDGHTIKSIDNLLTNVVIFVEGNDVYFTIDKKHLPGTLQFDSDVKIEATQIPDEAPIKYMMIGW